MDDAAAYPNKLDECLLRRFGHRSFRPGQREVVEAVLAGRDALAVLPTGGGKSLIYQLPAVVSGRTTLVVSPLIALMRDQVTAARGRGLAAASADSTLGPAERASVLSAVREGRLDLLYVAPEGLSRIAREIGGSCRLGLVAVDEAHCISQWGHDYRPDYRLLGDAREQLDGRAPLLAVTATATERVVADITASLRMRDPLVVRGSFFRPNLRLAARRKDPCRDARAEVLGLVRAHPADPAIVYRLSRSGAASLAGWLSRRGVAAVPYHAGLDDGRRAEVQDSFLSGRTRVVVATVAFGMGVDKSDVRLVIHADLPDSIEAYAQEIGRAGRDGRPADCVLFYSWRDVKRRDALAAGLGPQRREAARVAVREVYRMAAGGRCRQRTVCAHFGEAIAVPCGACDVCGALSVARRLRARG